MTIGNRIDHLIEDLIISSGRVADRILTWLGPVEKTRMQIVWADAFAEEEAKTEVWEPNQLPDELWKPTSENPVYQQLLEDFEASFDSSFDAFYGEFPDLAPGVGAPVERVADTQVSAGPVAYVPSPGARPGHSNHVAAVKHIIANGLEWDYENETFDEWLTKTAVEILNALQK